MPSLCASVSSCGMSHAPPWTSTEQPARQSHNAATTGACLTERHRHASGRAAYAGLPCCEDGALWPPNTTRAVGASSGGTVAVTSAPPACPCPPPRKGAVLHHDARPRQELSRRLGTDNARCVKHDAIGTLVWCLRALAPARALAAMCAVQLCTRQNLRDSLVCEITAPTHRVRWLRHWQSTRRTCGPNSRRSC